MLPVPVAEMKKERQGVKNQSMSGPREGMAKILLLDPNYKEEKEEGSDG